MINTNELMLGNWVEYATGINGDKRSIPMYVKAIFRDEVYLDFEGNDGDVWEEKEENLLGIPITEELLEKCGFKKIEGERSYRIDDAVIIYGVPSTKCWMIRMFAFGKIPVFDIHELQNAYFMLTNKHLEVKL